MQWVLGIIVLVGVALLLRRLLHMEGAAKPPVNGLAPLRSDLQAVYRPLAQEIEAHAMILGITLNDAFGEREENRHEMAWRVVRLAVGEWARLAELVVGVQTILTKFVPATNGIVPLRRVASGHFKSREVIDYVRLYEFLDQVLFSSKHRFSLQLRLLVRASALLGKSFRHACREGERTLDSSEELWSHLDCFFHDFDLIAKETLLALRTLLVCQSPEAVEEIALDLRALLESSMRVSLSPSEQ